MTGSGPSSQRPVQPDDAAGPVADGPPPSSAAVRADRLSAANMVRSLLPLVLICLLVVGWQAFRTGSPDPVREIDPSGTLRLADFRADYPLLVPEGLASGYRPTSVHTDAGDAVEGEPVTVEIGYVTPSGRYAGFLVTDDPGAEPLEAVLEGATADGEVVIDGDTWTRSVTDRGETLFSRTEDGVTVLVTGSAGDDELRAVAGAVGPYAGG